MGPSCAVMVRELCMGCIVRVCMEGARPLVTLLSVMQRDSGVGYCPVTFGCLLHLKLA